MKKQLLLAAAIALTASCTTATTDELGIDTSLRTITLTVNASEDSEPTTRVSLSEDAESQSWITTWDEGDALGGWSSGNSSLSKFEMVGDYDPASSQFAGSVSSNALRLVYPYDSSSTINGSLYSVDYSLQRADMSGDALGTMGSYIYLISSELIDVEIYATTTPRMQHVGAAIELNIRFENLESNIEATLKQIEFGCASSDVNCSQIPVSAELDLMASVSDGSAYSSTESGTTTIKIDNSPTIVAYDESNSDATTYTIRFSSLPFTVNASESIAFKVYLNYTDSTTGDSSVVSQICYLSNSTSDDIEFARSTYNTLNKICDLADASTEPDASNPDDLNSLLPLIDYVDFTISPNFKLGAAVKSDDFNKKGTLYNIAVENFNEVVSTYHMKHSAIVQDDGSMDFSTVDTFIQNCDEAGVELFGHALCWYVANNTNYLNDLIQETVTSTQGSTSSDEWSEIVVNGDMESSDYYPVSEWKTATGCVSAEGEGYGGTGYCYTITNSTVSANSYNAQARITLGAENAFLAYDEFKVRFDVRANTNITLSPTTLSSASSSYLIGFAPGSIDVTTEWQTIEFDLSAESCGKAEKFSSAHNLVFDFGGYAGTLYFDNISVLRKNQDDWSDESYEALDTAITASMENWVKTMMEHAPNVKAWDAINEPMRDDSPLELRSGEASAATGDIFYWNDYMGDDYARDVIRFARQYGGEDLLLFVNDYGLQWKHQNCGKLQGIINWIEYWESDGVTRIDGIGSQMHLTYSTKVNTQEYLKEGILDMYEMVAQTDKLFKISELDIILQDDSGNDIATTDMTAEQHQMMADFYQFIIEKYFEMIPVEQQYGITHWTIFDAPLGTTWRPGLPTGLWTEQGERKTNYASYVLGLQSRW